MKRWRYIFLPGVFLGLFAGNASAEVKIDKITEKGKRATVRFTYKNDSDNTHSIVKIECSVREADAKRDKGIAYLNDHFSGGIKPGYSSSGTVEVNLQAAKATDITCQDIPRPVVVK